MGHHCGAPQMTAMTERLRQRRPTDFHLDCVCCQDKSLPHHDERGPVSSLSGDWESPPGERSRMRGLSVGFCCWQPASLVGSSQLSVSGEKSVFSHLHGRFCVEAHEQAPGCLGNVTDWPPWEQLSFHPASPPRYPPVGTYVGCKFLLCQLWRDSSLHRSRLGLRNYGFMLYLPLKTGNLWVTPKWIRIAGQNSLQNPETPFKHVPLSL